VHELVGDHVVDQAHGGNALPTTRHLDIVATRIVYSSSMRRSAALGMAMLLLAGIAVASCSRNAGPSDPTSQDSATKALAPPSECLLPRHVWAPAPFGMSVRLLGVPVDEDFRPLDGVGSLVPVEFVDEPTKTNRFTSGWGEVGTEAELRASFNAWIVSGGGEARSMSRTITLDNLFVRETLQFVPAYRMREPPARSAYVITAIEVGHLAQVRFERGESALSGHLAARIKRFDGEMSGLKEELGVEAKIHALGVDADTGKGPLKPLTVDEFEQEFSANAQAAVPVRVRYTPVRGRELRDAELEWAKSYVVHIAPGTLDIADDGTWFSTDWELRLSCMKNKTPLRRRDYRTWVDVNPKRDKHGGIIKDEDGNSTSVVLFKGTFDGRRAIDLTAKWVELDAEADDQIQCTLSLRTKDNPTDSLGNAGTWEILSARITDGMRSGRPATIKGAGKYRFTLPFATEFRVEGVEG
jgi:hypothetical protein